MEKEIPIVCALQDNVFPVNCQTLCQKKESDWNDTPTGCKFDSYVD
jgi:hypothetical protein